MVNQVWEIFYFSANEFGAFKPYEDSSDQGHVLFDILPELIQNSQTIGGILSLISFFKTQMKITFANSYINQSRIRYKTSPSANTTLFRNCSCKDLLLLHGVHDMRIKWQILGHCTRSKGILKDGSIWWRYKIHLSS